MIRALLVVLAGLGPGCVLKGQHELVRVQLEATRNAFSTRAAECEREIRGLEEQVAERQLRIDEAGVRVDQLRTMSELKDGELESVVAEQVALAEELREARAELDVLQARIERFEELERMRAARRRRRGAAPEPETKAPDEGEPELSEADEIAASAGERALQRLQGRVLAQLDRERAAQLDDQTHEVLRSRLVELVQSDFLDVERADDGTVVRIETRRLVQEGWATLSPRGRQLVGSVGEVLRDLPGRIVSVEGHTDDAPVHSAQFASNWERGFGRAIAVVRQLLSVAPQLRISATSYAGRRPLVPHDTADAANQNRRVEIWIRADPSLLDRAPIDDQESSASETPLEEAKGRPGQ